MPCHILLMVGGVPTRLSLLPPLGGRLVYTLAYLAVGSLPWQHDSEAHAELKKPEMLKDASQLRRVLTESGVASAHEAGLHEATDALQALWAEVVRCRGDNNGRGASVDYDTCLAALRGVRGGEEEEVKAPFDWDI